MLLAHTRIPFLPGGFLGVDLFFVLSGFLITTLLLREREAGGRILLGRFYARRALRLLPALLLVVGAALCYGAGWAPAEVAREMPLDAAATLLYVENWVRGMTPHTGPLLGHAWSLSVEEQFYLSWPLLCAAAGALWPPARARRALLLAALLGCAGSAGLRAALYHGLSSVPRLYHGTDTRADTLLLGCALAVLLAGPGAAAGLSRARREIAALAAISTLILLGLLPWARADQAFFYRGGFTLVALCGAVLVLFAVSGGGPAGPGRRVLRAAPLVWLGRISYGLYLWHYPIAQACRLHGWFGPAGRLCAALLALGAAALSYHLVERPFLALKERLGKRRQGDQG